MPNPRRRPLGPGGTAKNVLALWAIILLLAAAQPQSVNNVHNALHRQQRDLLSSTIKGAVPQQSPRAQPSRSPAEIPLLNLDTTTIKRKSTELSKDEDTFLAIARAYSDAALRAPLAQSSESTRLSSLSAARSLQDWEVENIVLLATIDGAIHARDRKTGQERWVLAPDSPMIETIHHRTNRSDEDDTQPKDDEYMFIVEPSKDGSLYIQFSDPKKGLQKLDATVRSLAANTPQLVSDPPLVYVAQQETTMYTIDAASGDILSQFDMQNMFFNNQAERSCRRVSGFELDQPEGEPMGTLNLGRIQYTIKVYSTLSSELLCTIKYSEWTPNTRDGDLQSQHIAPLDRYHIQSFHDGRITGWDLAAQSYRAPRFTHVLETPVARVFDVVRPANDKASSAPLAVLSQPVDPLNPSSIDDWESNFQQTKVYVNQTGLGHWYAMSELSYPGVTNSATLAKRFTDPFGKQELLNFDEDMEDLIGVHVLSQPVYGGPSMPLTISAGVLNSDIALKQDSGLVETPSLQPSIFSEPQSGKGVWAVAVCSMMLTSVLLFVVSLQDNHPLSQAFKGLLRRRGYSISVSKIGDASQKSSVEADPVAEKTTSGVDADLVNATQTVKASEVGENAIDGFSSPRSRATSSSGLAKVSSSKGKVLSNSLSGEDVQDILDQSSDNESEDSKPQDDDVVQFPENNSTETKKRRTKRGRRGGKNNKKGKKSMSPEALDEEQSAIVPEVHQKDGIMQVGKLRLDTRPDRCLGHGSNGTAVFPGHLDGREVAVKRLIRSANSLAAKEIKHLLSSDENPHVIRYCGKEE